MSRCERYFKLEEERDEMRDAWMTTVHVKRVRAIQADWVDRPTVSMYQELDATGKQIRMRWERWLGHVCRMFYTIANC